MGLNRAQREENGVNIFYISMFQDGGTLVDHVFSSGALAVVKECKIITLKYTGTACRLYLLYSRAPEDIILSAIRPGSTKFEGKHFNKLI